MTKIINKLNFPSLTRVGSCFLVAAFALLSMTNGNAQPWNCGAQGSNLTATLSSGVLTINGIGDMADYGYTSMPWYSYRNTITTVVIGNSVTTIGDAAFYNFSNIASLTIGSSVASIGYSSFEGCSGLISVTIPNNVTDINGQAFLDCNNLAYLTIGNRLTTIGFRAFGNCSSLTAVTLPNSLTTINFNAFENCSSLTSVTIPDNVVSMGSAVFSGCSALTSAIIGNGITTIDLSTFENCSKLKSVTIGNRVKTITGTAFLGCSSLSSITIPDSVTTIAGGAFSTCDSLHTVNFNAIDGISMPYPFLGCKAFTTLNIGNQVKTIPTGMFQMCNGLTSVSIPDGVTSIGGDAFWNCKSLRTVTIGNGVKDINNGAFASCDTLTTLTIGKNVGFISNSAFAYNNNLQTIHYNAINCTTAYIFNGAPSLTTLNIGDSVQIISNSAFLNCSNLTSVNFPNSNSLTTIQQSAFSGCKSLRSVTIPSGVTTLEYTAFGYCDSLHTVNFNAINCTGMNYVFWGCPAFTTLNIGNQVKTIPDNAFQGCSSLTLVTIPDSVTFIGDYAFQNCTSLHTVNFNAINCTMTNGVQNSSYNPVFTYCPAFTTLNIGNRVKKIPDFAFSGCVFTSITIPNSVTSIGDYAFRASNLDSITIPNGVTSIGDAAFLGCSHLNSATLGNSVTTIGIQAFASCSGLTSITIPDNVTYIGNSAFYNCSQLQTVNFNAINCTMTTGLDINGNFYPVFIQCNAFTTLNVGNQVQTIPDFAFAACYGLTSVTIPNNVTSIGRNAFQACGFTSITIPNSVTSIGGYAFQACNGLNSATIGSSVGTIGIRAFYNCTNLTSVTLGNSIKNIQDSAFANCTGLGLGLGIVTNHSSAPAAINANVFQNVRIDTCQLKVPAVALSAYQGANVWKDFLISSAGASFLVNLVSNNNQYGYTTGGGMYGLNDTAIVSATANANYNFVNWTKNSSVVSTNNPYIFIVTGDVELMANFALDTNISDTVVIAQSDEVSQIKNKMERAINKYNTVTVIGSKTNANVTLGFDIPAGKKVLWQATYQTSTTLGSISAVDALGDTIMVSALICFSGSGSFEVAGGTLTANANHAIYSNGTNAAIVINSGTVTSTTSETIDVQGNNAIITINGGTISATMENAVIARGTNAKVFVSGGTLSNTATVPTPVIFMVNMNNSGLNVVVSGTAKIQATMNASAIVTYGSVEVKDNAQIIAATFNAIAATDNPMSTVTVSGASKVESNGNNNATILTDGNVEIKDSAQVNNTAASNSIFARSVNSMVTVGGTAKVESMNNSAIATYGNVEIKNSAQVISAKSNAIYSIDNPSSMITIGGTSKIEAKGAYPTVFTYGNVEVKDNAQIYADSAMGIRAYGDNSIVTIKGGTVSNAYPDAWNHPVVCVDNLNNNKLNVIVSGTGKVEAKEAACAIYSLGGVEVKDKAEVIANHHSAIWTQLDSAKVKVSGGTVRNASLSYEPAINMGNTYSSNILVSGTGKVQATGNGNAISSLFGYVEIKDSAQIIANDGPAINVANILTVSGESKIESNGFDNAISAAYMVIKDNVRVTNTNGSALYSSSTNGTTITVSGTSKIEAMGYYPAIHTFGSVEIKGNAQVLSNYGDAIYTFTDGVGYPDNSSITVSGGTVSSAAGHAIYTTGANASVTVSNGTITSTTAETIKMDGENAVVTVSGGAIGATSENAIITDGIYAKVLVSGGTLSNAAIGDYPVIYMRSGTTTSVIISGTAKVQATMEGSAIVTGGTVEVKDQAQVMATIGNAIRNHYSSAPVTVSGGLVFAYGNAIIDSVGVIYTPHNPSGFTVTGTGVAIAWDEAAGNTTYDVDATNDIIKMPSSATAKWARLGSNNGISYANGANTGLIVLDITVGEKEDGATVAAPIKDVTTHNSIAIYAVTPPSNGQTVEYGINTSTTPPSIWQSGLTFSGLSANSIYYVFARAKENNSYNTGAEVYTPIATDRIPVANSGGTANLTYTPTAIDLDAISGLFVIDIHAGQRTYSVETDASSTGIGTINGNHLTVTKSGVFKIGLVTAINNDYAAGALVIATLTVNKAAGDMVTAPTLSNKGGTSITVNAPAPPSSGQAIEYAINTVNSEPAYWQKSLTFSKLTFNTEYYLFARAAENDNYNVGAASSALSVVTDSTVLPPVIITDSLPNGTVNTEYNVTLAFTGDSPMWMLEDGNLPDGLKLGSDGTILGIPTTEGTFTFTVKAENEVGSDTKELFIVIEKEVGIKELRITNYELRVYPNPANAQLRIANCELRNNGVIEIYNVVGQIVQSKIVNLQSEITIDISHLTNGMYFLRIGDKTAKFVKE